MGLPIQSAPTYKTMLPSDGREIKFRPFLVKEQKVLMLAKEGDDQEGACQEGDPEEKGARREAGMDVAHRQDYRHTHRLL